MKKILVIFSLITLSFGASAQRTAERHEHEGSHHAYRSRVIIVPSLSYGFGYGYGYPYPGYPYYGNPYLGYPYGNPYPFYQNRRMPYKLNLQIQAIKEDYRNKIKDTRKDKSLSHAEKKKEIRSLRAERDQEIINAEKDFSKPGRMNNQNPGTYNQGENDNNS